jgi:small-conductance mechanosensitive channel
MGQLPGVKLPDAKAKDAKAAVEEESDAAKTKRLQGWLAEWRSQVEALDKGGTLPAGVTPEEVAVRRSDLLQGIFTAENSLRAIETSATLKQALDQARESASLWKGFDTPGPYSFTLHDEQRRQLEGIQTRLRAYESAATMFERGLAQRQDEIRKADEALRRAQEAADRASAADLDAAAWRLAAAKLKLRVLGASAAMIQSTIANTRLRVSTAKVEEEALARKVAALGSEVAFPEQDIERLRAGTEARRKEITRQMSAMEREHQTVISSRQSALAKLDTLKAAAATDDTAAGKIAEAEEDIQLLDSQLESLANRIEITGARLRFLGEYLDAQLHRRKLLTTGSAADRAEALADLRAQLDRATAFDSLVDVRRSTTLSGIQEHESKLAALDATSPRRKGVDRLQASLRADLDVLERFGQDLNGLHQDIARWIADAETAAAAMGWGERARGFGSRLGAALVKVRDVVVYRYEDKSEVDGQWVTVKRGLTLGWLLAALGFFWLAYRCGSWMVKRGFKRIVAKGRMQQGQADTLRRWSRIALAAVLALVTLHFLKIPLTAFAFLGGALAIGVGFGTQTLFKNFISGLIVLAERNVRVGDILEVDGVAGTVKAIDTRSSIVRSFDGVDMIVPNSVLLENKVVNWTHGTAVIRRVVRVRVAYGAPLRLVSTLLGECAAEHGVILKSPEPQVVLEDFAPDALVFAVFFWIDLHGKVGGSTVASDLRFMIERRLGDAGIPLAGPPHSPAAPATPAPATPAQDPS